MSAGGRAGRYDEVGLSDTVGESMKVTSVSGTERCLTYQDVTPR